MLSMDDDKEKNFIIAACYRVAASDLGVKRSRIKLSFPGIQAPKKKWQGRGLLASESVTVLEIPFQLQDQ